MSEEATRDSYTRVTTILYPFSGLDNIHPEVVAAAAERGTLVHNICESIMHGLGDIGITPEVHGYVDSFKQWFNEGVDIVEIEKRFWDDDLCITGKVDMIVKTESGMTIVDLKTSYKPSKTWLCQGQAYAYLARKNGFPITDIMFLHLNKTGKAPKIHRYPIDDDFFLSVYRVWKHFYEKKSKTPKVINE